MKKEDWLKAIFEHSQLYPDSNEFPSPWGLLVCAKPEDVWGQVRDIFIEEHYGSEIDPPARHIVDCGGNIGLSAIYFATANPEAEVSVYEADPTLAELIVENAKRSNTSDQITVHPEAVYDRTGEITFAQSGDDKGAIAVNGVSLPCRDIAETLTDQTTILKMDIEGAEFVCFNRIVEGSGLRNIRRVAAEIHLENDDPQRLSALVSLLQSEGFKVCLRGDIADYTGKAVTRSPFHFVRDNKMFLHIYAWR